MKGLNYLNCFAMRDAAESFGAFAVALERYKYFLLDSSQSICLYYATLRERGQTEMVIL